MSFGRSINASDNTAPGYLFAETPLTWEANPKIAINLNPKLAWSATGNLWGFGISANIHLTPRWDIIPEANIVLNSQQESTYISPSMEGLRQCCNRDLEAMPPRLQT